MKTIEKLQEQLEQAKIKIKFAKTSKRIVEAYVNNTFTFKNPYLGDTVSLFFTNQPLFCSSGLWIDSTDFKRYIEMYEICFNKKPSKELYNLRKDLNFINNQINKSGPEFKDILYNIADELIK